VAARRAPEPTIQPLSVRLPTVRNTLQLDVFLAALLISTALPVALFLACQRRPPRRRPQRCRQGVRPTCSGLTCRAARSADRWTSEIGDDEFCTRRSS
jgi:hypothetical protein